MTTGAADARVAVGLGELVWDLFSDGGEPRRLGGAPANVCYHSAALGDRGVLLSRAGQDALGDEALDLLARRGVEVGRVQRDPGHGTGTVRVTLQDGQPTYTIDDRGAWAFPAWTEAWQAQLAEADLLCFGSLLQCSAPGRAALSRATEHLAPGALRLLDLNLRPPLDPPRAVEAALDAANVVKLSEEEAQELSRRYRRRDVLDWLLDRRGMGAVALTRGRRGSLLCTREGSFDHPGLPTDTSAGDPVGAGDAFTAALAHHLVRGHDPRRTLEAANRYAAFVASCRGAMPRIPPEVVQACR